MTRDPDPLERLDDPDFPALTMSQAADLLGVQAAFLRSLDSSGVLQPHRSTGGHRRYSRAQLILAARMRSLLDEGHSLASAETILGLQDELATARADADRLRTDVDRLRSDDGRGSPSTAPGPPRTSTATSTARTSTRPPTRSPATSGPDGPPGPLG